MSKSAAGYINKILDPLLAKRAGVSTALITAWSEIVGRDLADMSMPIKVRWPSRASEDDAFQPGTLLVAAEGMAALHIQHQTGEVIDRVNAFMGYRAIARIKLMQKPIEKKKPKKRLKPITEGEKRKIDRLADGIEDEALKESLKRFGQSVMRDKK
ncbi:DciA family protein [Ahrensia kielensis]|uniref:DciA family protein n=1 Tax=Ahrensia kielensis TaxID=76980 RepID=A0ABU9T7X5_9HYPH